MKLARSKLDIPLGAIDLEISIDRYILSFKSDASWKGDLICDPLNGHVAGNSHVVAIFISWHGRRFG